MLHGIIGAGQRCAVDMRQLQLPITDKEALEILKKEGFSEVSVEVDSLARSLIGVAQYKRGADSREAPDIVDCSSMVKWLYTQKGIWLPRYSIEQRDYLEVTVEIDDAQSGDLVFTAGRHNYYWSDSSDGVGHVGIITNNHTVIHAANPKRGVVESSLDSFLERGARGIRRFKNFPDLVTLECPVNRTVECSSAFRWIVLQNL